MELNNIKNTDSFGWKEKFILVFLPFAMGYFLSYLFRSVNAVISPNLVSEFELSASELGLLTSVYFLSFASLQIPIGLLLDRFGPRRTNACLLIVAGVGACIFSSAQNFEGLLLGRVFIGFGVAACLMSSIKVFSIWFSPEILSTMIGRIMFVGGLGAISATKPVEMLLRVTGWREIFLGLAFLVIAASIVVFFVVPEKKFERSTASFREQLSGAFGVYRSPVFWRIAMGTALFQAFNMSVQGLWAGPWLADVAGLSRADVANHLMGLGVSTMLGFLFWGAFATYLAKRGIQAIQLLIVATALYLLLQLLLVFGLSELSWLIWIGWGLLGTSGSLAFTIISQSFPLSMTGRTTTALNLLVFVTAFLSQWIFGVILNQWELVGTSYNPEGYAAAFGIFMAFQLFGFVWMVVGYRREKPV